MYTYLGYGCFTLQSNTENASSLLFFVSVSKSNEKFGDMQQKSRSHNHREIMISYMCDSPCSFRRFLEWDAMDD